MKSFMFRKWLYRLSAIIPILILCFAASGQYTTVIDSSGSSERKVIPGKEYAAGSLKQFLWGRDYRREWTTPIVVPVLNMDTAFGGLTPVEVGGGRQTKSLHLKDAQGRSYVMRSVNKTYTLALPPIARGTFVETIANDQIATNHPFAALTVPAMATKAGVYHTNPKIYLVPYSSRLGQYNKIFANMLVLLEERPDETHSDKASFGYPKDIDGSEKMVKEITKDNDAFLDQHAYVKTRLFDMFLGDWGRHIDNWRWAQFDSSDTKYYRPVPKDRDQTWAKFEGLMLTLLRSVGGLKDLQSFGPRITDLLWFNKPAIEIDRRFANEMPRQVWIDSAKALQQYLTDDVIEKAVKQMPPETFSISGQEIINSLKQRRNDLPGYASSYYDFLAKVVEIPGSKKHELFEVKRLNDDQTQVSIFKINKEGEVKNKIYSRTFLTAETKEIRLYGLDGNDVYHVNGDVNNGITVRIIAGPGKDSLVDASHVNGRTHRTKFYDNIGTAIATSPETKIRLSDSTYLYPFQEDYKFDERGFTIVPGLNSYYRIFVGVAYKKRTHGWREKPFKSEWKAGMNYSITEKSFHPYFTAEFPQLFGAWNFNVNLGYDGVRRFNFFGVGNESVKQSIDQPFHYLRTENFYAGAGLNLPFASHHNIGLDVNYDGVKVIAQEGTFLSKPSTVVDNSNFNRKHFGTAAINYQFKKLDEEILPTKGLHFLAAAGYTKNLQDFDRGFAKLSSSMQIYLPLFRPFSLLINTGAATIDGEAEFYQLNQIGGNLTVRGFLRNRFYGKSVFYNQNELRWIPNVKSYLFNGRAGLIALYDVGRVWNPGETSEKWHYGYGGGIILSPFNKITAAAYYSISEEDKVVNFRIGKFF